jgi:murein DD-endopeptidase MepM/ murein hydrolase activator NlpD
MVPVKPREAPSQLSQKAWCALSQTSAQGPIYDQWFEISRAAMDPLLRWNEIAFSAAEKVALRNLNVAHDYIDLGVRQLNLTCDVRDPDKWTDEESKLVSKFRQKIGEHAGDYLKVARETQDAFKQWANDSAKHAAEATQRAVDTTAKATSEAARSAAGAPRSAGGQPSQPGQQPQPVHR